MAKDKDNPMTQDRAAPFLSDKVTGNFDVVIPDGMYNGDTDKNPYQRGAGWMKWGLKPQGTSGTTQDQEPYTVVTPSRRK